MFYWPAYAPGKRVSSNKPWPASLQIFRCPLTGFFFFLIWLSVFSVLAHPNIVRTERSEGSSLFSDCNKYMEG